MDKKEVKEGILCLLEDRRGRTLEEIQDFLSANSVSGYSEEESNPILKGLLAEMQEECLIEQRFMADGSDMIDFAIEEDGLEFLRGQGSGQRKWNTGRPDPGMQGSIQQKMSGLEDME